MVKIGRQTVCLTVLRKVMQDLSAQKIPLFCAAQGLYNLQQGSVGFGVLADHFDQFLHNGSSSVNPSETTGNEKRQNLPLFSIDPGCLINHLTFDRDYRWQNPKNI
jgi:hypothetical protein